MKVLDATELEMRVGMDIVPPYHRYIQFLNDGKEVATVRISEDQANLLSGTLIRTHESENMYRDIEDAFKDVDIDFPE